MRNIIPMMPASADSHTLITGTPAGRPRGHPGTRRAGYGRSRPGTPEERTKIRRSVRALLGAVNQQPPHRSRCSVRP